MKSPKDHFCPVCGASVRVVGDEGTSHFEPLDGQRAREWEQRWEGQKARAEQAEAKLKALQGNVNP